MIPAWVKDYIGIPFKIKGQDKDGCDCYGLARLIQKEQFGNDWPSFVGDYDDDSIDEVGSAVALHKSKFHQVEVPEIGDIVLMNRRGVPTHIGIYIGNGRMIHNDIGVATCIQSLGSPKEKSRIEGFYRYVPS